MSNSAGDVIDDFYANRPKQKYQTKELNISIASDKVSILLDGETLLTGTLFSNAFVKYGELEEFKFTIGVEDN